VVWKKAKRSLVEAGAIVEEIELGEEFKGWEGTGGRYDKIVFTAGGISCDMEYKLGRNLVSHTVIDRAEHGIDRQETVKIWDELAALRPKFDRIASSYDGIITPSSLVEAPRRDEDDVPDFCTLWTGLHAPTINIPGFDGESGLPIGLTMVGARYVLVRV
jgi:amidase